MSYIKYFGDEKYVVPQFVLDDIEWEDVSWHDDVAPRFENKRLRLAVWTDATDPQDREYPEDWKRLSAVELILHENDASDLGNDTLFETEDSNSLQRWLCLYEAHMHVEDAITAINNSITPEDLIADELQGLLARLTEQMKNLV
jgi:uncharacterized coiled-coil protein SlyX